MNSKIFNLIKGFIICCFYIINCVHVHYFYYLFLLPNKNNQWLILLIHRYFIVNRDFVECLRITYE